MGNVGSNTANNMLKEIPVVPCIVDEKRNLSNRISVKVPHLILKYDKAGDVGNDRVISHNIYGNDIIHFCDFL